MNSVWVVYGWCAGDVWMICERCMDGMSRLV